MSDDLKPALNINPEDSPNELSAEEFQRQLYAWFEDRGILSELRAHLRMQMIGVLKETAIGKAVTTQFRQAVSPKLQAINLLIAEFLLHQEYHYSLCVFSTEVPLMNVFPDFSNSIMNKSSDHTFTDPKKWRFKHKDVTDILETFGILHESQENKDIAKMYYENCDESLLTCIVRILHLINGVTSNKNITADLIDRPRKELKTDSKIPDDKEIDAYAFKSDINLFTAINNNKDSLLSDNEIWTLKSINELLQRANVSKQCAAQIEDHILRILNVEKQRLQDEHKEEYAKLTVKLEEDSLRRVEKYKRKVAEIERTFEVERKKLEDELHCTKSSLKECAETLHNRFDKLEEQERILRNREKELKTKEEFMKRTQMVLENEMQKLNCEKYDFIQMKHKLQKEMEGKEKQFEQDQKFFKEMQEDCNNFKSDLKETCEAMSESILKSRKEMINHSQQTVDNGDVEVALMKQLVRHLQSENMVLRNQNRDQQVRVQQLAQNASLLIRGLANTDGRSTNTFSANFRGAQSSPLVAPSMPSLSVRGNNGLMQTNGSGEELNIRPPTSPRHYRHAVLPRETRRRLLSRRYSNASSSDEPSPTEDILREARQRLRNLEQESEEIDRNFREYRRNTTEISPRDREVRDRDRSVLEHESYFIARNRPCSSNQLSLSERFNISISNMDDNITRILGNRDQNIGTFQIVQNDFPSTSTTAPLNFRNTSTNSNIDGIQNKTIKTREQNKLFFQGVGSDNTFTDKERESRYLNMMKILGKSVTDPNDEELVLENLRTNDFRKNKLRSEDFIQGNRERDDFIESELCRVNFRDDNQRIIDDTRASTAQSGNTSAYLQDMLPGTSGISFSSIEISSDHEESLKSKKKENEED